MSAAIPIACLRLHSQRNNLNLTFKGLNYSACINTALLEVDRYALVEEVKNRSKRHDISSQHLVEIIEQLEMEDLDPWELCSGNDLQNILSLGLRRTLGNNSANAVRVEDIKRSLRLAYSNEEFNKSRLAASIRDWEKSNTDIQVLR